MGLKLNKTYQMDHCKGMGMLDPESIGVAVTSPPYYNARDQLFESLKEYYLFLEKMFEGVYRVLKNHRVFVVNISDVHCQVGKQSYSIQKLPLVAQTILAGQKAKFEYAGKIVWDKGEVQSKQGVDPYPFYFYPINCYEEIIVFHKHVLNKKKIPCPVCNSLQVNDNGQTEIGVQSWECKNPKCDRSKTGRGKRFSSRSIMMQKYRNFESKISKEILDIFRRDVARFPPTIKINTKGENIVGHHSPFPELVPRYAIECFSGVGDVVLDPCMGRGTSGIVALKYHRQFIGFDINPEFVKIANQNTKRYLNQKSLFAYV